MRKTVRTLLRTSMGIIGTRPKNGTQWGYIETPIKEADGDWRAEVCASVQSVTGIPIVANNIRLISTRVNHNSAKGKRYEVLYCVADVRDASMLANILTKDAEGTQTSEIPFAKILHGHSMKKDVVAFLKANSLLPRG